MSEFPWMQKTWNWFCHTWRTSFGAILLAVVMFFFGMAYQTKEITEDCKFAKVFRDGTTVYECQVRIR